MYDETIYDSCARARFAGCTFLRNIILALNTVRCCDDPGHCTNFDDLSYLATLISDLARVKTSITKAIPEATAVDTLEALIGQGNKSMESKEEVVKSSWSQDPVHANLHAYYKLASNTIQMIEGGLKAPSSSGGKRLRTDSEDHQRGSGSRSGIDFGSGSGHGSGEGGAAKRQKSHNRHEQKGGEIYSNHDHFENYYGGRGGGGPLGNRGGGRHEYQQEGSYYGSGQYCQQRDDRHYPPRGEPRGRRFQGRRPYGGRGRF